jgi:hypothetical protein
MSVECLAQHQSHRLYSRAVNPYHLPCAPPCHPVIFTVWLPSPEAGGATQSAIREHKRKSCPYLSKHPHPSTPPPVDHGRGHSGHTRSSESSTHSCANPTSARPELAPTSSASTPSTQSRRAIHTRAISFDLAVTKPWFALQM